MGQALWRLESLCRRRWAIKPPASNGCPSWTAAPTRFDGSSGVGWAIPPGAVAAHLAHVESRPGSFMMAKWLDQKKDELSLKDKKLLELGSGTCSAGSLDFHFPLEPVFRLPGFVLAFFARRS